jgi:hypothetical protein
MSYFRTAKLLKIELVYTKLSGKGGWGQVGDDDDDDDDDDDKDIGEKWENIKMPLYFGKESAACLEVRVCVEVKKSKDKKKC